MSAMSMTNAPSATPAPIAQPQGFAEQPGQSRKKLAELLPMLLGGFAGDALFGGGHGIGKLAGIGGLGLGGLLLSGAFKKKAPPSAPAAMQAPTNPLLAGQMGPI